jgi:hypothetical protein
MTLGFLTQVNGEVGTDEQTIYMCVCVLIEPSCDNLLFLKHL